MIQESATQLNMGMGMLKNRVERLPEIQDFISKRIGFYSADIKFSQAMERRNEWINEPGADQEYVELMELYEKTRDLPDGNDLKNVIEEQKAEIRNRRNVRDVKLILDNIGGFSPEMTDYLVTFADNEDGFGEKEFKAMCEYLAVNPKIEGVEPEFSLESMIAGWINFKIDREKGEKFKADNPMVGEFLASIITGNEEYFYHELLTGISQGKILKPKGEAIVSLDGVEETQAPGWRRIGAYMRPNEHGMEMNFSFGQIFGHESVVMKVIRSQIDQSDLPVMLCLSEGQYNDTKNFLEDDFGKLVAELSSEEILNDANQELMMIRFAKIALKSQYFLEYIHGFGGNKSIAQEFLKKTISKVSSDTEVILGCGVATKGADRTAIDRGNEPEARGEDGKVDLSLNRKSTAGDLDKAANVNDWVDRVLGGGRKKLKVCHSMGGFQGALAALKADEKSKFILTAPVCLKDRKFLKLFTEKINFLLPLIGQMGRLNYGAAGTVMKIGKELTITDIILNGLIQENVKGLIPSILEGVRKVHDNSLNDPVALTNQVLGLWQVSFDSTPWWPVVNKLARNRIVSIMVAENDNILDPDMMYKKLTGDGFGSGIFAKMTREERLEVAKQQDRPGRPNIATDDLITYVFDAIHYLEVTENGNKALVYRVEEALDEFLKEDKAEKAKLIAAISEL